MIWLVLGCASEPLDARAFFDLEVAPVLEGSCLDGGCHGVTPDAEERGEQIDWDLFFVRLDAAGDIASTEQAYVAAKRAIDPSQQPVFSSLLRKPLDTAWGGSPHAGGGNFVTPDDEDFLALAAWVVLEDEGGETPEPLDELEQRYADTVQRLLVELTCTNGNCHGPTGTGFSLAQPVDGLFSIEDTRSNHETVRSMLALWGDPDQARLLRKALPIHAGGELHKGGNDAFLTGLDDPRAEAIVAWACAEREEATGEACRQDPSAVVYVAGTMPDEGPFDLDVYAPGSTLRTVSLADHADAELLDLSEAWDLRDPAIDATGTQLLFAARPSADEGHAVWLLDLATDELTQLTEPVGALDGGGFETHRHPTWGPGEHVWYVSTGHGLLDDAGERLDGDLVELDPDSGEQWWRSFTPHVEADLTFWTIGEEAGGELGFTALRDTLPEQRRAHPFRFPPGLATEYHQHFGITPDEDFFADMVELADGRYACTVGTLDLALDGGDLAIVDRNFGPHLVEDVQPALPFYADPFTVVAEGRWLQPAALPDGSLVATHVGETATVELVTLTEAPDGSGPVLATQTTLAAGWDPVPVFVRPPLHEDEPSWDPDEATGKLHHQGLPQVDALLHNLPPTGDKSPPEDIVAVRLVAHAPQTPADRVMVSGDDTLYGVSGTSTGLGHLGPQRLLGELELADDGTFQAAFPAGLAFRIQALDADGFQVGEPHNRWFDVQGGQVVPQGVQPRHYDQLCARCHGSQSGEADETFPEPDVITTASLTLARYEEQDPRRPIDADLFEAETGVGFADDVRPILDEHCTGCHDGTTEPDLRDTATTWFDRGYEELLRPGDRSEGGYDLVAADVGLARQSYLIELLTQSELEAPGVVGDHEDFDDDDLQTLIRWIELGATWSSP